MSGIEGWKEGQTWGAGKFFTSNGTPVTKQVDLKGGEYEVYVRMFTSPSAPADIRIWLNDRCLIPPMQAKVCKFGWLRLGSVVLPEGELDIRVESPTPGQESEHNFGALAFCSDPMDNRVGRIIAFTEWLRQELIRLEAPLPAPRTGSEARERQQILRSDLLTSLGLDPLPPRTLLNPRVIGRIEKEDYAIEKVAYESRPNHVVPALLYLPKNASGPVPAVISAIGHWSYGKSSKAPQYRGIGLAKHGYAVLALDPVYAWERHIPGNNEGFDPFVAGGCIAGHEVWDIMRGADYLETRPDIDATRLAVTGASGGGLQTFYAGAVDERFDAVMPAVALWPMSELSINFYYSADNWVPGISRMGGMSSLIALTAPRSMLIMNVDADYATSYACEQMVNAARPYYRLLGSESQIFHTIEPGVHDYTQ
ncbi:MAG: acetylxylan esterase, partial [Candidatus Omnitrophica bacterium]|nr:acetylxylan esterase [Candidatus Omnitrophota bacterium]